MFVIFFSVLVFRVLYLFLFRLLLKLVEVREHTNIYNKDIAFFAAAAKTKQQEQKYI